MAFLGKGSKVDLQYIATEMGVEDVLGIEFLNTIIEERERKEKIEFAERKRKEEIELDERKRKEDRELAERKKKKR
ncbi:hypothetical protein TNCV_455931 [Trichonephila clavipes]|nr:hypothetical protein TNCV_455931 [Trichonephila clavipes]